MRSAVLSLAHSAGQPTLLGARAQLTYEYQINQPPPLGHPDCQFPELTLPGMCANMVVYIPESPNAVRPGTLPHRPLNADNSCSDCIYICLARTGPVLHADVDGLTLAGSTVLGRV